MGLEHGNCIKNRASVWIIHSFSHKILIKPHSSFSFSHFIRNWVPWGSTSFETSSSSILSLHNRKGTKLVHNADGLREEENMIHESIKTLLVSSFSAPPSSKKVCFPFSQLLNASDSKRQHSRHETDKSKKEQSANYSWECFLDVSFKCAINWLLNKRYLSFRLHKTLLRIFRVSN